MKKLAVFTLIFILSGCSYFSAKLAPIELKQAVAAGASVAAASVEDPPGGQDLIDYLKANAELWEQLAEFFEVK